MTARDCATGTLQVCSHWEDVQILAPDPRACRWQHVWLCKRGFSCQPLPGQYLGFLWFEWFPSKLSEELNFHVMGRPERLCVRCCAVPLLAVYSVICFLSSRAWCPVPQHRRHNTRLHEFIVDKNNGRHQTKSDRSSPLKTLQTKSLMTSRASCKQCCKLCVSHVYGLTQSDGQLWENDTEKASHNRISCLKCFEPVCVNRIQSAQQ